ncbi:MAG: ComF family protein [Rubricoccaceae bacterium]
MPALLPAHLAPLPSLRAPLRAALAAFANLLYPPLCLGCDARVPSPELPLCPECLRTLPRAEPEALARTLSRLERLPPLRAAHALWAFDAGGTVQRLQHAVKYGGHEALGWRLGTLLAEAVDEAVWAGRDVRPEAVVPVPLARLRRLERGYNQAEALAEGLADALGVPLETAWLTRHAETRSQTRLSRQARQQNLAGAFRAAEDAAGRRILLVDDVLTTGATLAEAARALGALEADVAIAALAAVA